MRLTADAGKLAREIKHALTCTAEKGTLPVLSHVLLIADRNLAIAATDLDISLRSSLDVEIAEPGRACVPGKKLADVISSLSGPVTLTVAKDKHVEISGGRSLIKIAILPADDFPALPVESGPVLIEIPGADLETLINRTAAAISTDDEKRYHITGALMSATREQVVMVTTDGHRLAYAVAAAPQAKDGGERLLIDRKALESLRRITDGAAVRIGQGDNFIRFECGDRVLYAKRIDGQFPEHRKIIEVLGSAIVNVDVDALGRVVKRVALLAHGGTRAVKLKLSPGELAVSSSATDLGSADDAIPLEYRGKEIEIALNAGYVLDFLAAAGDLKTISLGLTSGEHQAVFTSPERDLRHIVMPMRL